MRKSCVPLACTLLALAIVGPAARADVTLLPDNADWTVLGQYDTITNSISTSNFAASTVYAGGGALTVGHSYESSFGYTDNLSDPTFWEPDTVLHLETQIDLSGNDLGSIDYSIAIDNDYELFVNGIQVDESNAPGNERGPGNGGAYYHDGEPGFGTPALLPYLQAGVNTIDVIAVDRGGGTYFDMNVTGPDDTPGVPDASSSALLLAVSLACLLLAGPRAARIRCGTGTR